MQVIARSILRLLRRRNFATGPAQCVASALPRNLSALSWPLSGGWPPALVRRRDSTRMAPPNPFGPRVFRFPTASRNMANTSGIKGQKLPKVDNGEGNGGGIVQNGKKDMKRKGANDAILLCGEGPPGEPSDNEEFACSEDEVHDSDEDFSSSEDEIHNYNCYNYPTKDGDPRCICANTFPYSMHRDGSIYKRGWSWKTYYRIANRDESSLIEMTSPKRGIELCDTTLIEYDMRIKTGREEKEDLQLIDGVSFVDDISTRTTYTFTRRIHGDSGAVDITVSRLDNAVEATIEIYISGVGSSFNLCVGCFTSGLREKIQLFNGAIVASRGLRRYVVAVVMDTCMDVKLKVGSGLSSRGDNAENCCTFKATNHGWTSQQIKVGFASILVKVTWSTLSFMSNNPLILPPVENS